MTPPSSSSTLSPLRLRTRSSKLLLTMIGTTVVLLWTLASVITPVQAADCGDPVCQETIDDLQERIQMVRREHAGLIKDNEKLENELTDLKIGLEDEKVAREEAHNAMQQLFKEIKQLNKELGLPSIAQEAEKEPFCDKTIQQCPEGWKNTA